MVEGGLGSLSTIILEVYNSLISLFPPFVQKFVNLFLLVLLVVLYSIFVWKFYRFIATKNILGLNLNQYNKSQHPLFMKLLAGALYFLEYIIILPFLIFFWFAVFTLFLIVIIESLDIQKILILSATVVAAIRVTSYYKEELSKEIAKLLPFTLLVISMLNPTFFNVDRIFTHFNALPNLLGEILIYLLFIVCLEIILRFFDFIFSLFHLEE